MSVTNKLFCSTSSLAISQQQRTASKGLQMFSKRSSAFSLVASRRTSGHCRTSPNLQVQNSAERKKRAVITGANTGLGKVSALELAKAGYSITLACRSEERGQKAANEIANTLSTSAADADLEVMQLDLSRLDSVAGFSEEYMSRHGMCDVLMNNAGVMAPPSREVTADGFELQIGVNHLGHFALTGQMLPALLAAGEARVVNVASVAHTFADGIDFENINSEGFFGYPFMGWRAYGQSKLANVMFTYELDRRLRAAGVSGVDVNAVHPGVVDTELPRLLPINFYPIMKSLGQLCSCEEGARGQIMLARDAALRGTSGKYFAELANEGRLGEHEMRPSSAASYVASDAQRLWDMSVKMTGVDYDFTIPPIVLPTEVEI
mmetsp:Transcript_13433/g.16186  ORF Transcript_13433/g.16186 Transcript_13433/m.16186 type:complete len:378 (-) Transcript_13433:190-1323(-)